MFDQTIIEAVDAGYIAPETKPRSLFQFLAWRGGLRPDPELRAILDKRNPFIPGAGVLVRKTGMGLDTAREACVEAGFLRGLSEETDEASINDLLDLIGAEARGQKQYRECDAALAWTMNNLGEPAAASGNGAEPVPTSNQRQRRDNMTKQEMTKREFNECLESIGLSVYAAAPFFGISLRQMQRISAGEYPAPLALVRLLRLMVHSKLKAEDL